MASRPGVSEYSCSRAQLATLRHYRPKVFQEPEECLGMMKIASVYGPVAWKKPRGTGTNNEERIYRTNRVNESTSNDMVEDAYLRTWLTAHGEVKWNNMTNSKSLSREYFPGSTRSRNEVKVSKLVSFYNEMGSYRASVGKTASRDFGISSARTTYSSPLINTSPSPSFHSARQSNTFEMTVKHTAVCQDEDSTAKTYAPRGFQERRPLLPYFCTAVGTGVNYSPRVHGGVMQTNNSFQSRKKNFTNYALTGMHGYSAQEAVREHSCNAFGNNTHSSNRNLLKINQKNGSSFNKATLPNSPSFSRSSEKRRPFTKTVNDFDKIQNAGIRNENDLYVKFKSAKEVFAQQCEKLYPFIPSSKTPGGNSLRELAVENKNCFIIDRTPEAGKGISSHRTSKRTDFYNQKSESRGAYDGRSTSPPYAKTTGNKVGDSISVSKVFRLQSHTLPAETQYYELSHTRGNTPPPSPNTFLIKNPTTELYPRRVINYCTPKEFSVPEKFRRHRDYVHSDICTPTIPITYFDKRSEKLRNKASLPLQEPQSCLHPFCSNCGLKREPLFECPGRNSVPDKWTTRVVPERMRRDGAPCTHDGGLCCDRGPDHSWKQTENSNSARAGRSSGGKRRPSIEFEPDLTTVNNSTTRFENNENTLPEGVPNEDSNRMSWVSRVVGYFEKITACEQPSSDGYNEPENSEKHKGVGCSVKEDSGLTQDQGVEGTETVNDPQDGYRRSYGEANMATSKSQGLNRSVSLRQKSRLNQTNLDITSTGDGKCKRFLSLLLTDKPEHQVIRDNNNKCKKTVTVVRSPSTPLTHARWSRSSLDVGTLATRDEQQATRGNNNKHGKNVKLARSFSAPTTQVRHKGSTLDHGTVAYYLKGECDRGVDCVRDEWLERMQVTSNATAEASEDIYRRKKMYSFSSEDNVSEPHSPDSRYFRRAVYGSIFADEEAYIGPEYWLKRKGHAGSESSDISSSTSGCEVNISEESQFPKSDSSDEYLDSDYGATEDNEDNSVHKLPQPCLRIMNILGKRETPQTLWCQIPEIANSDFFYKLTPSQRKLQETKFEVITSETTYIKCLYILISHFFESDRLNDETVLCKEDREILFSNIIDVKNCSQQFLTDLECCWQDDISLQDLDEIIYKHAEESFGVYITYCFNQIHQVNILSKLMKSELFANAISSLENHPICKRKTLQCYLIMPMQRVTRIRLLVDSIMARISLDNQKYQSWKITLDALNKVVQECNNAAKHAALLEKTKSLSEKLDFRGIKQLDMSKCFLVHHGQVLYTYSTNDPSCQSGAVPSSVIPAYKKLKKQTFTFGRKVIKQPLHFFLFTDVLLITKKKSEEIFVVLEYWPRSDLEVFDGDPFSFQELPLKNSSEHWQNVFHLFIQRSCEKVPIEMILCAPNKYEKKCWLDAFNNFPIIRGTYGHNEEKY